MKNVVARVLLVAVAVPTLYALAWYGDFLHRLPLALVVIAFAGAGGAELMRLLEPTAAGLRVAVGVALSAAPSVAAYLAQYVRGPGLESWGVASLASVLALFLFGGLPRAFARAKAEIRDSKRNSSSDALLLMYPGLLASALIPIIGAPGRGGMLAIWFSMIVFANDSLAWLVGITLGRRRGIFGVSPNKSLEGLLAGLVGSVSGAALGPVLMPTLLPAGVASPSLASLAIFGLVIGAFVVAGDLYESSLKRSAEIKDSGEAIPGRGGFLDSFDSILYAAPVFLAAMAVFGIL